MYAGIPNITSLQLAPNSSAGVCVVSKTQEKAVVLAPYFTPNSHTLVGKTGIASLSDYSSLSSSLASLHSNSPVGTLNTANKKSFRNSRPVSDQSSDYRYSLWLKMRVCPYFLLLPPSSRDFRAIATNRSSLPSSTSPNQLTTNSLPDANADAEIQGNKNCPLPKESCPFAHPAANVRIEAGHVTVCYDYIKRNKCKYTCCKYFHPPCYQIEEILKRGNEQRRLNHTQPNPPPQQSQSPLSNGGGGGLASTSTSACHQPHSTASAATVAKTTGIHWQPTSGAYNAYQLSGAAPVGLYPSTAPAAAAALHGGQMTAVPLPFSSTSAAASADPSLLLAAVLQQQQQRAAAAMLMAPVSSAATACGGGSSGEAVSADGSSGGSTITPRSCGSLPSHSMTTSQPTSAIAAATNGVCNGLSVSEFAQKMMALHQHQQQPVYDSNQSLRQHSHRSFSSPSLTACSPSVVTAALAGTSSAAVVSETSTAGATDIPSLLAGVSSASTAVGLCPGTKRRASDALAEAAEPSVDLHAWLSAKRAAYHPGADSVTDYGQMEGHNSSAMSNGASASLLTGSYIAGIAEHQHHQQQMHQQQHQRAEADLLSAIGDNPSSMAVASLAPVFSSGFAYQPTGYCPGSSIPPHLAAAAAAGGSGGGQVASLFNFYGLPYIQTAAMAQYPTAVYSTPQQAIGAGAGVDSQASIGVLALNNMLSQQSPAGQPVTVAGMSGQQPIFPGTPHQMANFAATLATLQQQQQSSADLRQMAAAPAAAAAPQQTAAFHQNQQQQQQQQAFFSALLRAHQSQLQQQLVAAQLAAAMQQVTGGAAYASQPQGSCIMDAQFSNGMNGIAAMASPYTVASCYPGVVQLQNPITNVAYINDKGNLLETLPICRDFKAGKCHRNGECRYVHLLDENVEVHHGRVTVCRDAAKGRCTRVPCKYFHVPLFAISAHRSLALNSVLHNSGNVGGGLVMAASATAPTASSSVMNNNNNPADASAAAVANGAGGNSL